METEVTSTKRAHMKILSDHEVVMSRVVDAPRALMFKINLKIRRLKIGKLRLSISVFIIKAT